MKSNVNKVSALKSIKTTKIEWICPIHWSYSDQCIPWSHRCSVLYQNIAAASSEMFLMPTSCPPAGGHPRASDSVWQQEERYCGWADRFSGPSPPCQQGQQRGKWWNRGKSTRILLPAIICHFAAAPTSHHGNGGLGQQASQHAHTRPVPSPRLNSQHAVVEPRIHQKAHAGHQQPCCQKGGLRDV